MALDKRTIIETYIAYKLAKKLLITKDDVYNVINVINDREGSEEDNSRYLRRCLEDLKNIGALVDDAKVRRVVDNAELEYTFGWEELFDNQEKCRYEGNQVRLANINVAHLTPIDYTFTLKPYNKTPEKLKKLYRIILFINSEYNMDYDKQVDKMSAFIESYSKMIPPTQESVGEMYVSVEYICKAIELEQGEKDAAMMDEYQSGKSVEERLQDIENMLVDLKMSGYGFNADPIDVNSKFKGGRRVTHRGF